MYYAANPLHEAGKRPRAGASAERTIDKVLLPVDGSVGALRAVAHLIASLGQGGRAEIHLLNVQPPLMSGDVGRTVTAEVVRRLRRTDGAKALERARELLERRGLRYRASVVLGSPAETIARYADDHGIDRIVMGTRGMSALGNLLLGSVAARVVRAADVPVTLVK
ncbi:MAG: universal stress protein [Burkholderiales bacterium]|nr:universal stress protein [Burkholderiales bacterium]